MRSTRGVLAKTGLTLTMLFSVAACGSFPARTLNIEVDNVAIAMPIKLPIIISQKSKPTATNLLGLNIQPEHPSGYKRALFKHWIDANKNGCDTRQEVLVTESLVPVTLGKGCKIIRGRWLSVYDSTEITVPSKLDVDHMVPLKEAWDSGAWNWSKSQRQAFANDLDQPYFLIAVTASSNRSKSDRDPAEWMPTNSAYRCEYIRNWIQIKTIWNLSVDQSEYNYLSNALAAC